ncbi:DUF1642 domain-containing protein [Enterococcus avium]|jgi:hypothetical protein|uniref:DUF1642 domain-containing protein n=1 Tax=Enterococcus avium TaxID=33945 RepID=UPI001D05D731|nr:DUF1642 domain-containing protein [Enterococcus avium]MCB6917349.1 DUF1642 domain-containing protein [Enterococcus avium]MCQ4961060.1 DUF1642 domain-containing protein [Enterococcus avium]DAV28707.1 MAG TPA: Protein of unknown function (DUF1642) [Caudoviricetes sp.]
MKQELLKWIYENKVGRPSVFGLGAVETVYMDDLIEMINELEEPQVTNEQAWNKIAESYPETAQNLRITLDHAVYGHETEPQKVKVPECVGELLDYYRKSADVDLLALLICFKDWYFRNDKTSESEEAIDWLVKHPEKFMKAWIDGYEVEEEPKWVVKVGNLYFCGWEDTTAQFVMNTVLGEDESIIKYKNEGTASSVAKNLGGTVEKV